MAATTILEIVATWRERGPAAWAESPYGWITETGEPAHLEP